MLLQDIFDKAVQFDSDLGELLRSCKVLASRLGSEPLEDWLVWESNGYPEEVELPQYRIWSLIVRGNFSGVFQSQLRNMRIPLTCLPEKWRGKIDVTRCRDSVTAIRHVISETEEEMIKTDLGDLALVLGFDVIEGMSCLSAWGEFHKSRLVEVLNSVRNRVLDFALAIWKEDPKAGEKPDASSSLTKDRVTQIFQTSVYGGSANVVGIAEKSNVSFEVRVGKSDSLVSYLKQHGIGDEDLQQLLKALEKDQKPCKKGSFGPEVAGWIGRMIEKAASGAWSVALSSATLLLTHAIEKFYGMT